jgi:hypothetical protein
MRRRVSAHHEIEHQQARSAACGLHGDRGGVRDSVDRQHGAFDLGRTDLDTPQVHGVVRAALRPEEAARQRLELVAVAAPELTARSRGRPLIVDLVMVAVEKRER